MHSNFIISISSTTEMSPKSWSINFIIKILSNWNIIWKFATPLKVKVTLWSLVIWAIKVWLYLIILATYLTSISDDAWDSDASASVFSNSSALSLMKFFCMFEIWAMIFSRRFAARRAFVFLAISFSCLVAEDIWSKVSREAEAFVICRTSINSWNSPSINLHLSLNRWLTKLTHSVTDDNLDL